MMKEELKVDVKVVLLIVFIVVIAMTGIYKYWPTKPIFYRTTDNGIVQVSPAPSQPVPIIQTVSTPAPQPVQEPEPSTIVPILLGKSRQEANKIIGITPDRASSHERSYVNATYCSASFSWFYENNRFNSYQLSVDFNYVTPLKVNEPRVKLEDLKKVRYVKYSYEGDNLNISSPEVKDIVPKEILSVKPISYYYNGSIYSQDEAKLLLIRYKIDHNYFDIMVRIYEPPLVEQKKDFNPEEGILKKIYRLNPSIDLNSTHLLMFEQFTDKDLGWQTCKISQGIGFYGAMLHKLDF